MVAVCKGRKLDVVSASVTNVYNSTCVTNQAVRYKGQIHGAMVISMLRCDA